MPDGAIITSDRYIQPAAFRHIAEDGCRRLLFVFLTLLQCYKVCMKNILIRSFLRRPLLLIAIVLICSILSGLHPLCRDPDGMRYSAAHGRRLYITGTVQSREITVNGYRLILDHLSFSGQKGHSSDIGRSVVASLNQAVSGGDRLQVFLTAGSREDDSVYGQEAETADLWGNPPVPADQSDLFERLQIGDRISLYGKVTQPEKATNPGQFDQRRYYLARRIVLKMIQVELKAVQKPSCSLLYQCFLIWRNAVCETRIGMQRGLLSVFGREDASQTAAFVLGDGSGLDAGTKQLFRDGGLSWLVCVSSLHISLLGMMLYRLLRARGLSFLLSSAGAFLAVSGYALLTGFSISAQRALVTFVIWLGAQIFGRTRDTLTSLSAAAIVILSRQPAALWDSSFLMSFVCILSLEYLTPCFTRILKLRLSWQRRICASLCLWFGSLPVVLWFFYQITPLASVLYPLMLPLMGMVLGFGILGSAGGCLYEWTQLPLCLYAGRVFAWPCRILLKALRMLCALEQDLPGSVLILGRPGVWQVASYYALLAALMIWAGNRGTYRSRRNSRPERPGKTALLLPAPGGSPLRTRLTLAGALASLLVMISLRWRPGFRYTCLDIGQGSCNLIEHGRYACLFDAGSSSVQNVWQYRIDSTLKYYGIRKLDAVFLSHGDMDHINGMEQMLGQYHTNLTGQNAGDVTVDRIVVPDLPSVDDRLVPILTSAATGGIRTDSAGSGACILLDQMKMEILSPSPDRLTGESNEDCIVMLLTYRDLRILFAGDLEKDGEKRFVEAWEEQPLFQNPSGGQNGNSGYKVILVAGHHGSKNATSREMLELVEPDLVFISCGKNNRYGHPAKEMLERLEEAGVPYHRTDLEGAIQVNQ